MNINKSFTARLAFRHQIAIIIIIIIIIEYTHIILYIIFRPRALIESKQQTHRNLPLYIYRNWAFIKLKMNTKLVEINFVTT